MYMSSYGEIVCYAQIVEFPKDYQIHMQKQRAFIQARSWTLCVSEGTRLESLKLSWGGFFFL